MFDDRETARVQVTRQPLVHTLVIVNRALGHVIKGGRADAWGPLPQSISRIPTIFGKRNGSWTCLVQTFGLTLNVTV